LALGPEIESNTNADDLTKIRSVLEEFRQDIIHKDGLDRRIDQQRFDLFRSGVLRVREGRENDNECERDAGLSQTLS
jgi:hypothetical protein